MVGRDGGVKLGKSMKIQQICDCRSQGVLTITPCVGCISKKVVIKRSGICSLNSVVSSTSSFDQV
jgi:hypothetical protein